jgi:hypothetical protein
VESIERKAREVGEKLGYYGTKERERKDSIVNSAKCCKDMEWIS